MTLSIRNKLFTIKSFNIDFSVDIVEWLIHFFAFLSTLFIGADILGIKIGINFRLDQLFLIITAILMVYKNKFDIFYIKWLPLFLIGSLISCIFAFNTTRALLYYFSILFNTIFVIYLYANYIKYYSMDKFLKMFRKTIYVSFIVFMLQYVLKLFLNYDISFLPSYGEFLGIKRFKLWFYEPSYMATYFIFTFMLSAYMYFIKNENSYLKDLIITSIMLILCTSTCGYIGMALVAFCIIIKKISTGFTKKDKYILITLVLLSCVIYAIFSKTFNFFIGRLFQGNLNGASGGRIEGWVVTIRVFKENLLFGVGPGCYGLYLENNTSLVPTNVTLDLLATLGIVGSLPFILMHLNLFKKIKNNCNYNKSIGKILAFSFIIFLIVLQFNQGYLRLYHWMFLGILYGCLIDNGQTTNMDINNYIKE